LFGIYINDELDSFLEEHIQGEDGSLLNHVLVSLLSFINDVTLLASSLEGLQRKINALSNVYDPKQLVVITLVKLRL
jgi:hypothetical protein